MPNVSTQLTVFEQDIHHPDIGIALFSNLSSEETYSLEKLLSQGTQEDSVGEHATPLHAGPVWRQCLPSARCPAAQSPAAASLRRLPQSLLQLAARSAPWERRQQLGCSPQVRIWTLLQPCQLWYPPFGVHGPVCAPLMHC